MALGPIFGGVLTGGAKCASSRFLRKCSRARKNETVAPWLAIPAQAQTVTSWDWAGREIGNSTTVGNTTTYYDRLGREAGRTTRFAGSATVYDRIGARDWPRSADTKAQVKKGAPARATFQCVSVSVPAPSHIRRPTNKRKPRTRLANDE